MPLTEATSEAHRRAAAEHQEVKRRVCAEFDVEQRHAATALLEQRGYSWLAATWEEKLAACLAASAARTALVERMKKAARKATWTLPATEPIRRDSWNRPVCADPAAQAPVAYELHRLSMLTAISEQPAAPSPYLSVISRKAFGASPKQVSEEHKLSRSLLVRNQSASHLAMFFGEEPASNPARAGCVQCGRYRCNGEDTCRRKPKLPPIDAVRKGDDYGGYGYGGHRGYRGYDSYWYREPTCYYCDGLHSTEKCPYREHHATWKHMDTFKRKAAVKAVIDGRAWGRSNVDDDPGRNYDSFGGHYGWHYAKYDYDDRY